MVVRILSSSASFSGVRYNTAKVDKNKGELMKVSGFGPLQALRDLQPEDYINYLAMLSAQNKRVVQTQFHATISAKRREYGKEALTDIATAWLKEMGYAEQPYLIVFHNDTGNNHVHIVSTRIDKAGNKISSAFENNRAIRNLNQVMGLDEKHSAEQDIAVALAYRFSTKSQFMMILESHGYVLKEAGDRLEVIKFGRKLSDISLPGLQERMSKFSDEKRRIQLRAIFAKYITLYDTTPVARVTNLPGGKTRLGKGYTSPFAEMLKAKFGIDLIFHGKDGLEPYGYTIIDHVRKSVFKGGEVMPLKELLTDRDTLFARQDMHALYPAIDESLIATGDMPIAAGSTAGISPVTSVTIADDVDDEAINGRNRKRKRKSRTNSR